MWTRNNSHQLPHCLISGHKKTAVWRALQSVHSGIFKELSDLQPDRWWRQDPLPSSRWCDLIIGQVLRPNADKWNIGPKDYKFDLTWNPHLDKCWNPIWVNSISIWNTINWLWPQTCTFFFFLVRQKSNVEKRDGKRKKKIRCRLFKLTAG